MLVAPSIARSESFTRSRASPRMVKVSGTKQFSSPSAEVFVSASLHVSDPEHAQARNINLKTSQPFVLGQAPRSSQSTANRSGKGSTSERPSTSGGNATLQQWNREQWDNIRKNRESRDDTYLTLVKTSEHQNQIEKSTMPIALPTPDATPPRGPSPEQRLTGEVTDMKGQNQNSLAIGMALGSPTQPQHHGEASPYRVNTNDQVQESKGPNEAASPISPVARQKQSKWKGLGSLFGRKAQKPSTTFYQLDGTPPNNNSPDIEQNTTFGGNPTPPDSANSKPRGRSNTTSSRKPAKQTPTRANTAPVKQKKGWSKKEAPEIQVDGGPMLDVEIPSIHLDRYSVMFSGVLGQSGTESASSLLARRQATLDKLKNVNEAIAQKEKEEAEAQRKLRTRRATSPQPTKSPAFSLFPTTVSGTHSQHVPRAPSPLDHLRSHNNKSGLSRSNTSPAALSPNRSTFHSDAESHIIMLDDGKALLNGISNRSAMKKHVQFSTQESTLMLSPQSIDSKELFSPNSNSPGNQSKISSSSSDEEENEEEIHVQSPLKPKLKEPDWQIIKPSRSEFETGSGPFKKEIELIDRITSPTTRRGRSGTITQVSTTPSTISTAQSSIAASPTSDISHPLSPLRSNPVPMSPRSASQGISPEPFHKYSSSVSTNSSSTTNTSDFPRRARSIKEIRADMKQRQASLSRSAQREQQRDIERAKVQAELDEAERTLESAAELSIARQISMSQKQRQLLKPMPTKPSIHRKAIGSGSIHSVSGSISDQGSIVGMPVEGFGNSRETDALLLSSGGFNNLLPTSSLSSANQNYTTDSSPSQSQALKPGSAATGSGIGGFDFNHYERPAMGATTISALASSDANPRIGNMAIMGVIGMGAVLKREVSGSTPTIVEPEFNGKGMGHRYQRSERVVLDG